ncbi:MAG: phage baseplate assembly protein V [Gammaproteobacteria bacterium]|nr:phage baseplate assembly protein V [Gammaproteobacteria bacterium]MDH5651348.1 phage baseplate assembly protein V [Gammaproteobacteria bacterium]
MSKQYFGKYRGKVANTIDPLQLGRIQVSVPAVLASGQLSWAMPCTPYAGPQVGFFAIPPVGANVWVEFEGGDPDYPIWVGCFWGVGEVPAIPAIDQIKMFKTENITMELSDVPGAGGFKLEVNPPAVATPMKMIFNSSGIEIDNNSIANMKLTVTEIQATHSSAPSITISPASIEIKHDPSKITVAPSDIESSNASSKVKISAASVDVESTATGKFSPAGVELKNGAQSVNLSAANVSINNGALEVM